MTGGVQDYPPFTPAPSEACGQNAVSRNGSARIWTGGDDRKDKKRDNFYDGHRYEIKDDACTYLRPLANGGVGPTPATVQGCLSYSPTPKVPDNALLEAQSDLIDNIRSNTFDGGAFLGELHKSATLIGDIARTIAEAANAYRERNLYKALLALGLVAPKPGSQGYKLTSNADKKWLALNYGVLPLLNDAKQAAEALATAINRPDTHSAKGKGKGRNETKSGHKTKSNKYRHKVKLKSRFKGQPTISDQLGLANPFASAWELLPFSFVLDWFVPIGDYMKVAGAHRKYDFESTCQTNFEEILQLRAAHPSFVGGDAAFVKEIRLIRTVNVSGDSPLDLNHLGMIRVKPLNESMSFKHMLSGIALLSQGFKGPPGIAGR